MGLYSMLQGQLHFTFLHVCRTGSQRIQRYVISSKPRLKSVNSQLQRVLIYYILCRGLMTVRKGNLASNNLNANRNAEICGLSLKLGSTLFALLPVATATLRRYGRVCVLKLAYLTSLASWQSKDCQKIAFKFRYRKLLK